MTLNVQEQYENMINQKDSTLEVAFCFNKLCIPIHSFVQNLGLSQTCLVTSTEWAWLVRITHSTGLNNSIVKKRMCILCVKDFA